MNWSNGRTEKGASLLDFFDSYTSIDIETTGLDPSYDDIIEVGAVHIKNGVIESTFQSLINPGYEIDEFITKLTGITNEMLAAAPKIETVLPDYINYLSNDVLVAHNANFDINFLYDNSLYYFKKPLKNNFIDAMRLGRHLFKDLPNHKLGTMTQHFGICDHIEHRSLSDALNAHYCYEYMKKYAYDNNIDITMLLNKKKSLRAKDIIATVNEFDESHPLYGKVVIFTGSLERILRKDAMQMVINLGGSCGDSVTKNTNFLVLGNNDYCKTIKDGKSNKHKRAEQLKLQGYDIEIISENIFYEMIFEN